MVVRQRSANPAEVAASGGPAIDQPLLEAALDAEARPQDWAGEFRWVLDHGALLPVAAEPAPSLGLSALNAQHATCFPRVSADEDWLASRSMAVVARRLAPLLAQGAAVALDLSALTRGGGHEPSPPEHLRLVVRGLEQVLPVALARQGLRARHLAFSAPAGHPGIAELLRLHRCAALGHPQLLIRLPNTLMRTLCTGGADQPAGGDESLLRLWHGLTGIAHREPGVHLLLQETTRSPCTLAAAERGNAVLPLSLFEARGDSAWLALELRLDRLLARSPATALVELRRLLRGTLRLADNLLEQVDWPSPELGQDALVNRRLALHLTGLGDVVDRWGLAPDDFATVRLALRWLRLVRRMLLHESNALAHERGPFPGLELQGLRASLGRSFGAEQAGRLLRRAGLRHRHLLVLSPYGVFPAGRPRHPLPAYLHLLPVMRLADSIAMHGDGIARALPVQAFRRLLRLSWAIAYHRP